MPSPRDNQPEERDPLDPFPTLLSSFGTTTRDPVPTYAAIARSPIAQARPLAAEGSTSQNAGPSTSTSNPNVTGTDNVNVNGNGNTNGTGHGGWSSDDVDRDDRLDEITTFPSSSSIFRSSPPPPPVAQPAARQTQNEAGPSSGVPPIGVASALRQLYTDTPEPVPGSVLSPASSHRPTGTTEAQDRHAYMTHFLARAQHARDVRNAAVERSPLLNDVLGEVERVLSEGTWDEGMSAAARHLEELEGEAGSARTSQRNRIGAGNITSIPSRGARAGGLQQSTRLSPAYHYGGVQAGGRLAVPGVQAGDGRMNPRQPASDLTSIRERLARLRADAGLPPVARDDRDGEARIRRAQEIIVQEEDLEESSEDSEVDTVPSDFDDRQDDDGGRPTGWTEESRPATMEQLRRVMAVVPIQDDSAAADIQRRDTSLRVRPGPVERATLRNQPDSVERIAALGRIRRQNGNIADVVLGLDGDTAPETENQIQRDTTRMAALRRRRNRMRAEREADRRQEERDRETSNDPNLAIGPPAGSRLEETDRFLTAVNRTRRITEEARALARMRDQDNAEMLLYPPGGPAPDGQEDDEFGIWTTVGPDTAATTRRVRPFYAHPNVTGDIDIDAWETAFGDEPPIPLRRGGTIRRRGNTTRGPLEGHLPRAHGATETRDVRPLEVPTIAGLEPTNTGVNGEIVLVTSRRRERVEEDIQKRANSTKDGKRRKVAQDEINSYTSSPRISQWPTYLKHTSLDQTTPLPREFESTAETFLRVSYSTIGRPLIKFIDHPQLTGTDADASNIATLKPIPVECGIYYYEAECICEGEEGFMSIGLKSGKKSQNRLVGWDKGTFGWHSDDGMCFEQSGSGSDFAAKWTSGDTVGIGIDFTTGRAFFTKNGAFIGHRFKNLNSGLRPAFGLRSKGEELCINFTGPFRFDIDSYVEGIKDKFAEEVKKVTVNRIPRIEPWNVETLPTLGMISGSDDVEPMHRDEMEVDKPDTTQEEGAPMPVPKPELPATSVLRDPVEQTTAAFVLDYLTQQGYSSTLQATRQEMIKRDWIPADSSPSNHDELDQIHQVTRQMLDTSGPMPLEAIDQLCHETEMKDRSRVLQLVYLIRQSQTRTDDDMEEVLAFGKRLREESLKGHLLIGIVQVKWDSIAIEWLQEASGSIGLPMTHDQVDLWDKRRVELASKIEDSARMRFSLDRESVLATSLKQVQVINTVLAPGNPRTTFIDVRRQLGLM